MILLNATKPYTGREWSGGIAARPLLLTSEEVVPVSIGGAQSRYGTVYGRE